MRRYRSKRRFGRRRVMRKQRIFRRRRIIRQFTRPDGANSVKFTYSIDIQRQTDTTIYVVQWHGNTPIVNAHQVTAAVEYAVTTAPFEMKKTKGLKLMWEPVGNDNLPANRYVKSVHVGSYVNNGAQYLITNVPGVSEIQQKLDYRCYQGNKTFKRYYKVSKALKGVFQPPGQTPGGYCMIDPGIASDKEVDMGATAFIIQSLNFQDGDYMGKLTMTWYVNLKDRLVI